MSILGLRHEGQISKLQQAPEPALAGERSALKLTSRDIWLSIFLLFLVLEIPVLSLEKAHWITPQPALTLVLVLAVIAVWLGVALRFGVFVHFLAAGFGALVVLWQVNALKSTPTFYFAVFIASLTWLMGYLGTWFALKRHNGWVAVLIGAMVVIVNLSNLPAGYFIYFGFYFVAAVFFLVWMRFTRKPTAGAYSRYAGRGLVYFVGLLTSMIVLALSISWLVPDVRFPALQTVVATKTLWRQELEKSPFNFFAAVPSKQALSTSSMRLNLPFEAGWHQGERIDFFVASTKPSYWQVHTYEVYTSRGWENGPVNAHVLKAKARWGDTPSPARAEPLTYEVTPNIRTDALLISGSFLSASEPVLVQLSPGGVIGVLTSHILSPGERYAVKALAPAASPEVLAGAGDDYPPEIREHYLQLPPDFPQSVRELSANITRGAVTPYQKVLRINAYLSHLAYTTEVGEPPEGTDGVAYFLFHRRAGFCVHFASAMAVMLRASGVPARLAIGYLPGEPGAEKGVYVLRDKHYHAWPQVYFPGFGWVDIEATPSTSESAGSSEVPLTEPWVSSESLRELPQWDIWFFPGYYGFPEGEGQRESPKPAATAAVRPTYRGPWAFADELGKALVAGFLTLFFLSLVALPFILLRSSFYRWVWHVDRSKLATLAYEKLCQLGAMANLAPKPQETPLEYAAVLAKEFPDAAPAVYEITRAYIENRFAGRRGRLDLFDEARILKARCAIYERLLLRLGFLEKVFGGRW